MRTFLLFALVCASVHHAQGLASNNNSVLILGSSTTGGASSMERNTAVALGYTVDIATNAQWLAMTAADFASYRALFLGDPTCVVGESPIAAAITNVAVWAPVVTGNVVIQGTDPVYHNKPRTISAFQSFAASSTPGTTGLWLCLSCYYNDAVNLTRPWMNALKGPNGGPDFYMYGAGSIQNGCSLPAHIVAMSAALGDLTDADITGWGCSTHEGFSMWPTDYTPLAITQTSDGTGSFHAADGTMGYPYTLARGAVTLIGCQPNEIFTNGQCVPCGDGASSTGGACVCNNGNPYPDCGCGSGCASKTIAATCEATTVFSSSNCASLNFDAASPCT